jgi:DNA-binding transcriptional LysR family regulator
MPVSVSERLLAPHLPELRRRYPELRLELDLSDRNVPLVQGGFELAAVRPVPEPPGPGPGAPTLCDSGQFVAAGRSRDRASQPGRRPCWVHMSVGRAASWPLGPPLRIRVNAAASWAPDAECDAPWRAAGEYLRAIEQRCRRAAM